MQQPNSPPPASTLRYVDRPELLEVFADSIGLSSVEGQLARIELCVTWPDQASPPNPPAYRKRPVCQAQVRAPGQN